MPVYAEFWNPACTGSWSTSGSILPPSSPRGPPAASHRSERTKRYIILLCTSAQSPYLLIGMKPNKPWFPVCGSNCVSATKRCTCENHETQNPVRPILTQCKRVVPSFKSAPITFVMSDPHYTTEPRIADPPKKLNKQGAPRGPWGKWLAGGRVCGGVCGG